MTPEQRQTLCVELSVDLSDWMRGSRDTKLEYIDNEGMSNFESACGTLAAIDIYQPSPRHYCEYVVSVQPDDVREFVSNRAFSDHELDCLLESFFYHCQFCFLTPGWRGGSKEWAEPFEVPEEFQLPISALEGAGYIDVENNIGHWTAAAMPWLVPPYLINYDALPDVEPQTVAEAWESIPERAKSHLQRTPPYHDAVMYLCSFQSKAGWTLAYDPSGVPNKYWNVPLVHAILRYRESLPR